MLHRLGYALILLAIIPSMATKSFACPPCHVIWLNYCPCDYYWCLPWNPRPSFPHGFTYYVSEYQDGDVKPQRFVVTLDWPVQNGTWLWHYLPQLGRNAYVKVVGRDYLAYEVKNSVFENDHFSTVVKQGQKDKNAMTRLIITLPENARLTVNDEPTSKTGSERTFKTPALEAGEKYYYKMKAEYMHDGELVTVEKNIQFTAGKDRELQVDMVDRTRQVLAKNHR